MMKRFPLFCLLLMMMLLIACGSSSDTAENQTRVGESPQSAFDTSQTSDDRRCSRPAVKPHYLPWLTDDEEVPPPTESYDEELDRVQLSWQDPRFSENEAGVGLTLYPLTRGVSGGSPTGVEIAGSDGRMHEGEGGTVSMSWDLSRECNFLELVVANPQLQVGELKHQLLRVARSLR